MPTLFIYSLPITPQFHTEKHAQEKRGNLVTARKSKMAAVEESSMCGFCFSVTKYTCSKCGNFFVRDVRFLTKRRPVGKQEEVSHVVKVVFVTRCRMKD